MHKLARAKLLSADHGINYRTTPDWDKAAMEITGGRGVDQMVEVGGAGTLAKSFSAIRVGGKITMISNLSGPATELKPGLIMARRANIQGISVGSTQMFEAMNRAIAANRIKPVIDKVFDFEEAMAAYQHMAAGAHSGRSSSGWRHDPRGGGRSAAYQGCPQFQRDPIEPSTNPRGVGQAQLGDEI